MSRLTDPQDAQESYEKFHALIGDLASTLNSRYGKLSAEQLVEEVTLNARHANANRSDETVNRRPDESYGSESLATNLRESVRRHVEVQENDQIYPIGQVIKAYCEILDIRFQALFIKVGEDHWHQTGNEDCVTWRELLDWLSGDHVVAYDLAVDWHSVWSR